MFWCECVMCICAWGGVIVFSGSIAAPRSDLRIPGLFWAHSHKDFKLWFSKDFTARIS